MWVATVVAAIFSYGTGGVAVAGGRAALGAGLKALAKGATKVGLKKAGKSMAKQGSKQLAKSAVKVGLKKNMRGWVNYKGKGLAKRIAKQAGANLKSKKSRLLLTGAVAGAIYETAGSSIVPNNPTKNKTSGQDTIGTIYSLVESEPTTEMVNCQDIDYGEGCYAICNHDQPTDDLNVKVFKPLLGETYCVSDKDYTLYNTKTNKPLVLTEEQYKKIKQKIKSDIVDQGEKENFFGTLFNQKNVRHGCDYNEDDIDLYFGSYVYDPDTLAPSTSLIIEEVIRIDD